MIHDYDHYSLVHDQTNLLKFITTPSSVKSLVEDGRSLIVGNTYGGSVTEFAIVSQWRKYWSIVGVSSNFDVGPRKSSVMSSR